MVLIFPIGVTMSYFKLLFTNRKKIMQDVETREKVKCCEERSEELGMR